MAIYKVINEENETLNESGGAHQKLIDLRDKRRKELEDKIADTKRIANNPGNSLAQRNYADKLKYKLKNKYNDTVKFKGAYVPERAKHGKYKDDIDDLKHALGVGDNHLYGLERKHPGTYKKLYDIKKHEAAETFDMCADYVVGCLEGNVDELDLDLFTEASAFIIDCLNEDDE